MKKKLVSALLVTVMAVSMFTACGSSDEGIQSNDSVEIELPGMDTKDAEETGADEAETEKDGTEEASASTDTGVPTKDRSGNDISVPDSVEKIISLAPSTTQLLIDLGYADQIIACDTYSGSSYGDLLAAEIPQFDMMSPDNEQIAALEPDIVFTTGMSYSGGEDVYAAVKEAGVCVADIPSSSSLAEIEEDILFIGACIGADEKAETIVDEMERGIAELKEIAAAIPENEKKTVLYELSTPTADYPEIYSCGTGTYIDEMITLIGAVNVAGEQGSQWLSLTEEEAVAANPDIILSGDTYTPDVVNVILNTEGWENVTAVKEKAVYAVDGDAINRPNHHVVSAIYELAKLIYPEYFGEAVIPFAA